MRLTCPCCATELPIESGVIDAGRWVRFYYQQKFAFGAEAGGQTIVVNPDRDSKAESHAQGRKVLADAAFTGPRFAQSLQHARTFCIALFN